jgi:hypothetical protein
MDWNEVKTPADAAALIKVFGGFHDACIREAHLWTEHYVRSDLHMTCSPGLDNRIRILIQRQFKNPSAIELLFENVTRFNLVPTPENYDSIILAATLLVQDSNTFWSPVGDWTPDQPDRNEFTWISAKKLRWRDVDWLGKKLWYGPVDERDVSSCH